jgi:hypothetical protein
MILISMFDIRSASQYWHVGTPRASIAQSTTSLSAAWPTPAQVLDNPNGARTAVTLMVSDLDAHIKRLRT